MPDHPYKEKRAKKQKVSPKIIIDITSKDDNYKKEKLDSINANASINQLFINNNSKTEDYEIDYNDNDTKAMDIILVTTSF